MLRKSQQIQANSEAEYQNEVPNLIYKWVWVS